MKSDTIQMPFQQKLGQYSSMKAIQILAALAGRHGAYITITELSEITGLSASTIHRVLQELLACGFVEKDKHQHSYRIGIGAWVFSRQLSSSDYLRIAAQTEMTRLNDLTGETIQLIDLEGDTGVYLYRIACKHPIGLLSQVGMRVPLYCSSGGKVLLAWQSHEWIHSYFDRVTLEPFTEHTIVDQEHLLQELAGIRRQGYALNDGEHHDDVVGVAVPIFGDSGNVICSVGISAPGYRLTREKALGYVPELKKSAILIQARLQGKV